MHFTAAEQKFDFRLNLKWQGNINVRFCKIFYKEKKSL